jgi:hypothetical protein
MPNQKNQPTALQSVFQGLDRLVFVNASTLRVSQKVIPEAVLIGHPDFKSLKSWMPGRTLQV